MASQTLKKIDIRMYYTGFGDCFLLTFHYETGKPQTLWIDFGSRAGDADRMRDIADDICQYLSELHKTDDSTPKPRVDVLAITHEHEDHISGFSKAQAKANLADLEIDQLWFAWTEQPDDLLATQWRDYQNRARLTLQKAFAKLSTNLAPDSPRVERLRNLFGFDVGTEVLAANSPDKSVTELGTEVYAFLRDKAKHTDYKRPGQLLHNFPGIRTYVLGPPEDMNYVRKEQSSRAGELYLQASYTSEDYSLGQSLGIGSGAGNDNSEKVVGLDTGSEKSTDFWHYVQKAPFDEEFVLPIPPNTNDPNGLSLGDQHSPVSSRYVKQYEALKKTAAYKSYYDTDNNWRTIDDDYLQSADNLAMRLNSSTNNTSLVLAFEIEATGEVLFFPGDAQYGVWLAWQEDLERTQKDPIPPVKGKSPKAKFVENHRRLYEWTFADAKQDGQQRTVRAEDLLKETILYKVGHHGSHNATPKRTGLEKMLSPNLFALIPVSAEKAQSFHWDEIPYLKLLGALDERKATGNAKYIRSDELDKIDKDPQTWSAPTQWQIAYQRDEGKSQCLLCTLTPRQTA